MAKGVCSRQKVRRQPGTVPGSRWSYPGLLAWS